MFTLTLTRPDGTTREIRTRLAWWFGTSTLRCESAYIDESGFEHSWLKDTGRRITPEILYALADDLREIRAAMEDDHDCTTEKCEARRDWVERLSEEDDHA